MRIPWRADEHRAMTNQTAGMERTRPRKHTMAGLRDLSDAYPNTIPPVRPTHGCRMVLWNQIGSIPPMPPPSERDAMMADSQSS